MRLIVESLPTLRQTCRAAESNRHQRVGVLPGECRVGGRIESGELSVEQHPCLLHEAEAHQVVTVVEAH